MSQENRQQPPANTLDSESTICTPGGAPLDALSPADTVLCLVMLEGDDPGRSIPLGPEPVTAGRDPHLDIVLSGNAISRLHLLVTATDGAVVVEDLGSTNGTFIDGQRLHTRGPLPVGSVLRVGDHVFKCERRDRREIERATQERRDLERAANYVRSLLAEPLSDGPMRTEWMFLPSARLGGDAFGYQQLDPHTFVIYLLDVCGHGVGAAMHSVSVLNVLRQRAIQTDFKDPVRVISSLNAMFQMDRHDEQYFTMWYGVYDTLERTLTYASAGHHPAYLVAADRASPLPLKTPGVMVGAMPDCRVRAAETRIPAGGRLYLFSDGVFEVVTRKGQWHLDDFVALLREPIVSGSSECQRLYRSVKTALHPGQFEDDVSLLVVTFP